MAAAAGLEAGDAAALDDEARHLAVLDDVDAAVRGRAGVAPSDRIVPHRAAPPLQQAAADRKAGVAEIEKGHEGADRVLIEEFRVDAGKPHGVAAPRIGVALRVGMVEIENATLADHGVVVDVLLEPFPELQRPLVEGRVAGQEVVRADDRRVPADIARADEALLDDGHIREAVPAREVVGRCQAVAAAADDDDVVARLRRGVPPGGTPTALAGESLRREGEDRVAHRRGGPLRPPRLATIPRSA